MGCLKLHIEDEPTLRLAYSKKEVKPSKKVGRYYPFGLKHKGYNNVINGTENNYQTYNGKELEEALGLNWLDFGARNYDASLGRWFGIDQLAEKFNSFSPYNYVLNDPIKNLDPDGRDVFLEGNRRRKALRELRRANKNLKLKMNRKTGQVTATVRKGKKASKYESKLLKATTDNTVISTIVATNNKFASNGDPLLGNFMGNYTDENGVTHTRQELNHYGL